MFKDKNSEEIGEIRQLAEELKNPKIETEEKLLTEEESLDWVVDGINKTIRKRICSFFENDDTRIVKEYQMNIDNNDGKVILHFIKDGEIMHTESFKA